MNKRHLLFPLAIGCISVNPSAEELPFLPTWNIQGSNTVRASHYDTGGAIASSPYAIEGTMFYDELNLYMDKASGPFERWRIEIGGLLNVDDRYRSADSDIVPERLALTHENGSGDLPYRVEAGDIFTYHSNLTLQSSLKGVQLELQPVFDDPGRSHSILVTSGVNASSWKSLTPSADFTNAISWLVQDAELGALSVNLVNNHRDDDPTAGTLDRSQTVLSIAAEHPFTLAEQALTLEAEVASFQGDHNGLTGAASGQDRADMGYLLRLAGRSAALPLSYEAKWQRYGQDFRPRGAVVSADRQSSELFANWRSDDGVIARGRVQLFDDAFETANKQKTRTYGVNVSGPLFATIADDISGSVDAYIQNRNDETFTVSTLTESLDINLSKPLPGGWHGNLGATLQNIDDRTAATGDRSIRQLRLSGNRAIRIGNFSGTVTPGVVARSLRRGGSDAFEANPTLAIDLSHGPHALRMDYGSLIQNRLTAAATDIGTQTFNADYRYTQGQSTFGVEANLFNRDPSPGAGTEAYRLSMFWTYAFDRPAVTGYAAQRETAALPGLLPGGLLTIGALMPGAGQGAVKQRLRDAGIGSGRRIAGYRVYDYPLFVDLFQRQRLAVAFQDERLASTVAIIDFGNTGEVESVRQLYSRVRETLIRQLGSPSRNIEEGTLTGNIVAGINAGRIERITEWDTSAGVIRFGIPRRLDGQLRMEIHYARTSARLGETLWSVEALR